MAEELFDELVVASLQAPTYVRDFPVDTSPLTRDHRETPGLTEKWDLYIGGYETATAYSELVDPIVQRERFVEQARYAGLGDAEAMKLDEDFLRAMEYGMPPSGGMGMGVDRLIMALTGLGIRETILSPLSAPPTELTTASGAIAGYQQYGKDGFHLLFRPSAQSREGIRRSLSR